MSESLKFLPGDRVRFRNYDDLYREVCKYDGRCPKTAYSQEMLRHAGESYIFKNVFLGSVCFQGIDQDSIFSQWSVKESYLMLDDDNNEIIENDSIDTIFGDAFYEQ